MTSDPRERSAVDHLVIVTAETDKDFLITERGREKTLMVVRARGLFATVSVFTYEC